MTCPDCALATSQMWHGFTATCTGCRARSIARSPLYAELKKLGVQSPEYRRLIASLGISHDDVKAADQAVADAPKDRQP